MPLLKIKITIVIITLQYKIKKLNQSLCKKHRYYLARFDLTTTYLLLLLLLLFKNKSIVRVVVHSPSDHKYRHFLLLELYFFQEMMVMVHGTTTTTSVTKYTTIVPLLKTQSHTYNSSYIHPSQNRSY